MTPPGEVYEEEDLIVIDGCVYYDDGYYEEGWDEDEYLEDAEPWTENGTYG